MSNPDKHNEASVSSRKVASKLVLSVIKDGQSLSSLTSLTDGLEPRDAAFARLLAFGVLRYYHQLQALLAPLIKKPLKSKDLDIQVVLLMALYQILYTRVPDFAVVDVAVKQVRKSRKKWAANMVNGVLRNFLRQTEGKAPEALVKEINDIAARLAHPQWIVEQLKNDWPDECWQHILHENNVQASLFLRVNQQQANTAEYQVLLEREQKLESETIAQFPSALKLAQACDVTRLPGFEQGQVSVQDAGAQLAAQLLQPESGDSILDACAAPGGKTAHLYELQPDIHITALDISSTRLQRVDENCKRLGFEPELIVADACQTEDWWKGELFDKILLDVPCSAVGVIRRHPDIKHLRRKEDIENLVQLQREILIKNWALLKPGGQLLYATCSVFKAENEQQIACFLGLQNDAILLDLTEKVEHISQLKTEGPGVQLFPDVNHDGFYYALLQKKV